MSVFFKNTCSYTNCGKNFYTLTDLILHIENDHLGFDPNTVQQLEEEKPECLPMSYVLKFSGPDACPPKVSNLNEAVISEIEDVAPKEVMMFNNNYLDFKERKVWGETRLNQEEIPQILGGNKLFTEDHSHKKPFACNMRGCEKRYKNINGIKYHYKKHHKLLIPTLKKSILKHKSLLSPPEPRFERHDLHGIPLYNYNPLMANFLFHNMQRFEDCEPSQNDYFYKFSQPNTSDVHFPSTQVPLPNNMSFNYYNVTEVGDIEDFSGKNSTYIPNFDKF